MFLETFIFFLLCISVNPGNPGPEAHGLLDRIFFWSVLYVMLKQIPREATFDAGVCFLTQTQESGSRPNMQKDMPDRFTSGSSRIALFRDVRAIPADIQSDRYSDRLFDI